MKKLLFLATTMLLTIVAFAEEQGLALGSAELAIAAHKEFDQWAVCKGYALYNSKGTPLTVKERLTSKDREALVKGLLDGTVDMIATDHAPHLKEEKANNYAKAPSGLPLVQHSLQTMLELAHKETEHKVTFKAGP